MFPVPNLDINLFAVGLIGIDYYIRERSRTGRLSRAIIQQHYIRDMCLMFEGMIYS